MTGKKALADSDVDQWQNAYLTADLVMQDIEKGDSYIVTLNGEMVGTFVFSAEADEAYDRSGVYSTVDMYYSLHRVAVCPKFKGLGIGGIIVKFCIESCKTLGANALFCDTHADNSSMRKMLTKNGFEEIGPISLMNGDPRIGYELLL